MELINNLARINALIDQPFSLISLKRENLNRFIAQNIFRYFKLEPNLLENPDDRSKSAVSPLKFVRSIELTDFQKLANRALSSLRVGVEHSVRSLKKFRILSSVYRNRRKRLDLRLQLIASYYNFFIQNINYI
jgi:hypothetical protein